jgi:riboflavin synthase
MFTGLVETTGSCVSLDRLGESARLTLHAPTLAGEMSLGDSLAVNGCCLTVARIDGTGLVFDLLGETLARTNLGRLTSGARVNLERALPANGRLGGHFVQGHVDAISDVLRVEPRGADVHITVRLPAGFGRYVVYKGSVCINGTSLTVSEVMDAAFGVWIIPHTAAATNIGDLSAGDFVNLEFDLLAKYVERLMNVPR